MDKPSKIILYVLIGIAVVNFIMTFFSNGSLRGIRKDLEKANRTADSALFQLRTAKDLIDSTKSDIVKFRSYIDNIQKNAEANDLNLRIETEKDTKKLKEMKGRLRELRNDVDNDSLPPIDELIPKN